MTDPSSNDPENTSSNNPEEENEETTVSQESEGSQDNDTSEETAESDGVICAGEAIDEIHSLESQVRAWRIATVLIVLSIFTICVWSLISAVTSLSKGDGLVKFQDTIIERATEQGALWPQVVTAAQDFRNEAEPKLKDEVKALVDNEKDKFTARISGELKGMVNSITDRTTNAFNDVLNQEMEKKLGPIARMAGQTNNVEGVETIHQQMAREFNLKLMSSKAHSSTDVVKKLFDPQFKELLKIRNHLDFIYDKEMGQRTGERKRKVSLSLGLAMTQRIIRTLQKQERAMLDIQEGAAIEQRGKEGPPEKDSGTK